MVTPTAFLLDAAWLTIALSGLVLLAYVHDIILRLVADSPARAIFVATANVLVLLHCCCLVVLSVKMALPIYGLDATDLQGAVHTAISHFEPKP